MALVGRLIAAVPRYRQCDRTPTERPDDGLDFRRERRGRPLSQATRARHRPIGTVAHAAAARAATRPRLPPSPTDDTADDDEYAHPRVKAIRDRLIQDSLWSDHPEVLDDWWACEITSEADFVGLFVDPFHFGCEGDDRMVAAAVDGRLTQMGARLKPMLGSDIGHFDVTDMRDVVPKAHELVDERLVSEADFRDSRSPTSCACTAA
jgi:hypothetical protein